MLFKFYVANIMREDKDGNLTLVGSKITRTWFWESPMAAFMELAKGGGFPVDVRRIK